MGTCPLDSPCKLLMEVLWVKGAILEDMQENGSVRTDRCTNI